MQVRIWQGSDTLLYTVMFHLLYKCQCLSQLNVEMWVRVDEMYSFERYEMRFVVNVPLM